MVRGRIGGSCGGWTCMGAICSSSGAVASNSTNVKLTAKSPDSHAAARPRDPEFAAAWLVFAAAASPAAAARNSANGAACRAAGSQHASTRRHDACRRKR